jgi:hypothetical protein
VEEKMYFRHEFDRDGWGYSGGWTLAIDLDNRLIGISICSPKDQFNKKLGRLVAEDRAHMAVGDGRMFIITAPVGAHPATVALLHEALSNAISFVVERFPNTEFGVQYV